MNILDQLKELDKNRQQLIAAGKAEALKRAEAAIADLNALGFNYSLTEGTTAPPSPRRKGVRQQVLDIIKKHPDGIKRADILTKLNSTDAKSEQSISNAISALKKSAQITAAGGLYRPQK